ncbi:AMP-binding, conserved site-containing protein [Cynara cardunculus var. scolymus]|uniref:AMP-binding, conserved site-containing protein n=1 Tax=Cynara cardunculus var. scolymus TaxID=59895 RepID=A0A103YAZ6_CYNCS|nr:AMP-binding, conserved site-containing protein [Cynara cardunculus var. scolymus]
MAISDPYSSVNPNNGFCSKTYIYHSLRPPYPLPSQSSPFSVTGFIFSLLQTTVTPTASLIDATTRRRILHSDLQLLVRNLSFSLRQPPLSLSHGDCAFVISPNSSHLPILYLSLFSIGVVVSPSNPVSSVQEISRQIELSKPVVAFATVESIQKLLEAGSSNPVVLIGSSEFESMMRDGQSNGGDLKLKFGSMIRRRFCIPRGLRGRTGKVKGVKLTHRNLISAIAGAVSGRQTTLSREVYLCTVPYFHIYGFTLCLRMVAFGVSIVSIAKFDLRLMLRSIEEFSVSHLAVAPPVVVALVDGNNDDLVEGSNWSSLETVSSGPYENTKIGSVGRLVSHCEAKIINPETGVGLAPGNPGELWIRGPFVMKGYVDDKEVTDTTVDSNGWLKTSDLCYFDNEGFLFVVRNYSFQTLSGTLLVNGVPPVELEHILHLHPDIIEAALHIKTKMATSDSPSSINLQNGFCSKTRIYHSLRPPSPLPPLSSPFSITDFIFSHLQTTVTPIASFIDATTRRRILYSDLQLLVRNLSVSLRQPPLSLSHGDCAFVISPNSSLLPILYLSLLSIGVAVSPSNPVSSVLEVSRQIRLCKPAVAFATAESAQKLLEVGFTNPVVMIGSNEFESMMRDEPNGGRPKTEVSQSDTAAILYSSGTTGKIKGVKLTHRNLISMIAGAIDGRRARLSPAVYLSTVPLFHIYGFGLLLRLVAFGESMVSMRRFDLRLMLRSIEEFSVTNLAVAPPVVVALVDGKNGDLVDGINWKSIESVLCGGAPLTAYGMTETTGGVSRVVGPYESTIVGTVGRLIAHCEAKIVDPNTGVGYVDDEEVMDTMVESDGWLRTGDLCYFDNEGFLFVVDRLKELIKYRGYQVPPAELEHILHLHPDITEAAVIPYPDEEAGEVPMGFVVRRRGTTIDEAQVAPYKKLRRVRFVNSIPKNAPGKVLRKELIKLALSDLTSKL